MWKMISNANLLIKALTTGKKKLGVGITALILINSSPASPNVKVIATAIAAGFYALAEGFADSGRK